MPSVSARLPYYWYLDDAQKSAFDAAWPAIVQWYADTIHAFGVPHAGRPAPVVHTLPRRVHGDHVVADCGGLPVIAVRGADGVVRAFHNVCRHRAGPIAQCDGLGAKALRCRYHGWTYTLDGQLKSAPEMQSAEGFDAAAVRLPQLAVREWQGLVFAAIDEARAPSFDELIAGMDAGIGAARGLAGYGHHRHVAYDIACNWKGYVDNYLEGYHVPHVHPALNRMLDYRNYATELAR